MRSTPPPPPQRDGPGVAHLDGLGLASSIYDGTELEENVGVDFETPISGAPRGATEMPLRTNFVRFRSLEGARSLSKA